MPAAFALPIAFSPRQFRAPQQLHQCRATADTLSSQPPSSDRPVPRVPKRRGRPPKTKSGAAGSPDRTGAAGTPTEARSDAAGTPAVPRKRRGRPPKMPVKGVGGTQRKKSASVMKEEEIFGFWEDEDRKAARYEGDEYFSARKPSRMLPRRGEAADETPLERLSEIISAADGLNSGLDGGVRQDFVDELLPLFANSDLQAKADAAMREIAEQMSIEDPPFDETVSNVSEATAAMRLNAERLSNIYASMFRYNGAHDNLLPFKLRNEKTKTCAECVGSGVVICRYCEGVGTVSEDVCGPPGSIVGLGDKSAVVPEGGSMIGECICAFCVGLSKVPCFGCDGEGEVPSEIQSEAVNRKGTGRAGAAGEGVLRPATTAPDRDTFIKEHADRIEIGADGTLILRKSPYRKNIMSKARRKGTSSSEDKSRSATDAEPGVGINEAGPGTEPIAKRKRGRPRKVRKEPAQSSVSGSVPRNGNSPSPPAELGRISGGRGSVERSTDFLNTEYRVLRENRIAWFRKNNAAFSEELTKQQQADGDDARAWDIDLSES